MKKLLRFIKYTLLTILFLLGWLLFFVYLSELTGWGISRPARRHSVVLSVFMLFVSVGMCYKPSLMFYGFLRKKLHENASQGGLIARVFFIAVSIISVPAILSYWYKEYGREIFLAVGLYLDVHASGWPLTVVTILGVIYALIFIFVLVASGPRGFLVLLFFMFCLSMLTHVNYEADGIFFFHNEAGTQSAYTITMALFFSSIIAFYLFFVLVDNKESQLAKTLRGLSATLLICVFTAFMAVFLAKLVNESLLKILLLYLLAIFIAVVLRFYLEKWLAPDGLKQYKLGLYWKLLSTSVIACLSLKVFSTLVISDFQSVWLIDLPTAEFVGLNTVSFTSLADPRTAPLITNPTGFWGMVGLLYYSSTLALNLSFIPEFIASQLESCLYACLGKNEWVSV